MINYEVKKEEINNLYQTISKGRVFPFISPFKVTILDQGLHKKLNSNYYGVTMVKNKNKEEDNKLFCFLMGYYYVPENQLIVPKEHSLSDKDVSIIKKYSEKGYLVTSKPNLTFLDFDKASREWEVSNYFYSKHKENGYANN